MKRAKRAAYQAAAVLLAPALVLIVVGVLVLVYQREGFDIAFGVLILTFCLLLLLGTANFVWTLKRSADLSKLQADFLSKVSHDFRTPLTSIRMFVETLRDNRLDDPVRRDRVLALLGQETERLSTMIDRLLDFARLEAGRMQYHLEVLHLEPLIREVLGRFEARLAGSEIQLLCTVQAGVPAVAADKEAIAEVLQSLLDNAFKYAGPSKQIAVALRKRATKSVIDVELSVSDNGPGIPRKEQRKIFEQFYRIDDRLARATEGSGLGLAISQHIVHAHGGHIRVDSEPGHGATFVVTLPAVEQVIA